MSKSIFDANCPVSQITMRDAIDGILQAFRFNDDKAIKEDYQRRVDKGLIRPDSYQDVIEWLTDMLDKCPKASWKFEMDHVARAIFNAHVVLTIAAATDCRKRKDEARLKTLSFLQ